MLLSSLANKSIVFLGFEATNRALYKEARRRFPEQTFSIADKNDKLEIPDDPLLEAMLGPEYLSLLDDFDVIVRSPGVPYSVLPKRLRSRVTTATNLFFDEVRSKTSATIVGVTGTKGKSTTSTLICEVLKATKRDALLLGNIDIQDWDAIEKVKNNTTIVYEMSSYMLEDFTARPDIAVFLDIFPDHMDWHGSFENYLRAKSKITARQNTKDTFIYGGRFEPLKKIARTTKAKTVSLGELRGLHRDAEWFLDGDKKIFETSAVRILGAHNLDNVLAVLAVARELGIDADIVEGVVRSFSGLPHRLEFVAEKNGIKFYDDAISTTPESTLSAINTFNENLGGIILGGFDRGYDFTALAKRLVALRIPVIILLPGSREKIELALRSRVLNSSIPQFPVILHASDMPTAVSLLFTHCPTGSVALLSTATPSYDIFKNYKDQGDQFKKAVIHTRV